MVRLLLVFALVCLVVFGFKSYSFLTRTNQHIADDFRSVYPGGLGYEFQKEFIIARGEAILPELIRASYDADPSVRCSFAMLFGEIEARGSYARLLEMTEDIDEEVQYWAYVSLGRIGDREAIPELRSKLQDAEGFIIKGSILVSLVQLGEHSFIPDLVDVMEQTKKEVPTYGSPPHVFHGNVLRGNRVLEEISGLQFRSSIPRIREWLESRESGSGSQ